VTPDELEAHGLYDPAAVNAADRLAFLQWLAGRGVTIDEMVAAHREGSLPFLASGLALRPGRRMSRAAAAARLGVPAAQFEEFLLAFGLPPDAKDTATLTETETRLVGAFADGVALFGEPALQRLARVIGQSVARIAEAMVAMNREQQLGPLVSTSHSELAYAQAVLRAAESATAPSAMVRGLLPIHVELAAARLRRGRTSDVDETIQACVGFVDLVGFTTISRRTSSAALGDLIDRFEEVAHDVATARGGRVVKFIGDEVMFVTTQAASGCDIALALIERFAGDPTVTPRGGIATGEMLDRGGDYYGPVVNLAARIAELAVPEEVLVSEELAAAVQTPRFRCDPAGRRSLRGFDEPVSLLSVTRS